MRSLISTLLNITEDEILEVKVPNPIQHSDALSAKITVLDLRLHLNNNRYLNIEMQVRRFICWTNRTLVYSCRQITEQSNADGFDYENLEPVIHIAIMNYSLFEDHRRFFSKYELQDEEGYRYSDKIQFYVMDLRAIADATEEERKQGLVEWAEAFTAQSWDQIQRIENKGVKEAMEQMRIIMSKPDQRQIIWERRRAQLDFESQMKSERKEGRIDDARRMKAKGYVVAEITDITGLSAEEIEKI